MAGKFFRDDDGNFWEPHDMGSVTLWVPAPLWAGNINAYLFEGPNIFVRATKKPLCDVPELRRGSDPVDGGNLILTDDEKNELLRTDPHAEKFIRPYMMGRDFINRIARWCLWMKGVEPADIRKCPRVLERIERVREFRLTSPTKSTQRGADTPMLFLRPNEQATDYLAIPKVSSSARRYIPMGWLSSDVIAGDKLFVCENSTLYQFGMLNSSVHMAWVRIVSGRLRNDFSYSNTVDYNTFPWPSCPAPHHRAAIEKTAQAILDARALYPRSSLADLYDERTMPPELRRAHNANDEAVMAAYGFERRYEDDRMNDEDIVVRLLYMYKDLTGCREYVERYPNRALWEEYYGDEDGEPV